MKVKQELGMSQENFGPVEVAYLYMHQQEQCYFNEEPFTVEPTFNVSQFMVSPH